MNNAYVVSFHASLEPGSATTITHSLRRAGHPWVSEAWMKTPMDALAGRDSASAVDGINIFLKWEQRTPVTV
jgi:hypothetical protein